MNNPLEYTTLTGPNAGDEPIQFVAKAKKCGFDILEINVAKVTRFDNAERDTLKGAAADAGISLTYSIGMSADMDLVPEDAAIRKKGIDVNSCARN
jgi:D-psicose/D-tagatose/L-ribulose 3-epimerase